MIHTEYPYGNINEEKVIKIFKQNGKCYCVDGCGRWMISESAYDYLEKYINKIKKDI